MGPIRFVGLRPFFDPLRQFRWGIQTRTMAAQIIEFKLLMFPLHTTDDDSSPSEHHDSHPSHGDSSRLAGLAYFLLTISVVAGK